MKSVTTLVLVAILLALGGAGFLTAAGYEREMAAAEENLATLRYEAAAEKLSSAAEYATYGRWLPGAGDRAAKDLRANEAALRYWQKQYDTLLPRQADPVGAVEDEDVALQMLVANGAYRAGVSKATTRETTIQALDESISGYLTVLKGETWDERAAYNYEYLVRVRDELARGRRKTVPPPDDGDASMGAAGAPAKSPDMQKFEVYIPLEGEERNDASEAGKGTPNARKG